MIRQLRGRKRLMPTWDANNPTGLAHIIWDHFSHEGDELRIGISEIGSSNQISAGSFIFANIHGINSRHELAIYQPGTELGIILAEYTESWVKYTQDGRNPVIPTNDLKDKEMLVLHVLVDFELGDTAKMYLYSIRQYFVR